MPTGSDHEDRERFSRLEMDCESPKEQGGEKDQSCCFTWNTKKGAVALSLNSSEKSGTTISALKETRCHTLFLVGSPRGPTPEHLHFRARTASLGN